MTTPGPYLTTAQLAGRWHTTANAIRLRKSRGKLADIRTIPGGHERLWLAADVEKHERRRMKAAQAARTAA
jgi:hypothetical protein